MHVTQMIKNLQYGKPGFDPWIGKIPGRKERLFTPVFLPGEFHGERSQVGYHPWGHKKLDTAEGLSLNGTQWTLCMLWYRSDLVPRRSMSWPLQKISLWHQHWPPKWFFSYKIRQSFHTLKHVVCSEMNTIFRSQYLRVPYQRIWRHPQILPSLILVETGLCVGASTLILVL